MTKIFIFRNYRKFSLFILLMCCISVTSQVGIGTTTPDASSVLDINSTTKGMLAPRMTTAQRIAITSPADGLLVYDTTLKLFHYYVSSTASWSPVGSSVTERSNFKRIKSTDVLSTVLAAELAAGGGSKYLMNANTLYEINGQVTFDFPIEINNSYIHGFDTNNDIIIRPTGNIFEGATGGSIKNVTITATGGNVFNLSGTAAQNLIFRDCVVAGSSSVGTISGFGLVFLSIVQFTGNTNGITYNNISQLLLSNLGWFGNNAGTYEKFTGTFSLIEKQGGFIHVESGATGFDVSTAGLTVGSGILESVVFTGTNTAGYVKPYTTGTFTGYNFNNNWIVRSSGIPTETDNNAVGDFNVDYPVGQGIGVTFNTGTPSNIVKIGDANSISTSSNLFRFSTDGGVPNRLKYVGKNKRIFQITGSVSFQVPAAGTYIIYIAKNGTVLGQFKVYGRGSATNDIVVIPINGTTELLNNDYIEIFAQRFSGSTTGQIVVPNMSITIK